MHQIQSLEKDIGFESPLADWIHGSSKYHFGSLKIAL